MEAFNAPNVLPESHLLHESRRFKSQQNEQLNASSKKDVLRSFGAFAHRMGFQTSKVRNERLVASINPRNRCRPARPCGRWTR